MNLDQQTKNEIAQLINSDKVVLFMKGTRLQPQCGFSARTVGILDLLVDDYTTINVLENNTIREGIKTYSNWPTIPQLYINNEFIGGCDIVHEAFNSGELFEALGLQKPAIDKDPNVTFTEKAYELINNSLRAQKTNELLLFIDARGNHQFGIGQGQNQETTIQFKDITITMDPITAQRANGLQIDVEESLTGNRFVFNNPNMS